MFGFWQSTMLQSESIIQLEDWQAYKVAGLCTQGDEGLSNFLLASSWASSKDLKWIQTPHSLFKILEQRKPLQLFGQAAEFKIQSKIIALEGYSRTWRQLTILIAKSMAALGAVLQHSFGKSDCKLKHGISESSAVCVGKDRLAWRKSGLFLAILTTF